MVEDTGHEPAADTLPLDPVEQVDREDFGLRAEQLSRFAPDRPAAGEADDLAGAGLGHERLAAPDGIVCQNEVVADLRHRRPSVDQIIRIGMDTSKHVFQLHGVNAAEEPVLRKKLRRQDMVAFFRSLPPTVVGIEACGGSPSLGALAAVARASGEDAPTPVRQALRQTRQERCGRRRGAVRGDEPADHALRAGEDSGAAGGPDAGGLARPADPPAHPARQCHPRLCGRVWADRRQGDVQDRAAAGADQGG